MSSKARILIDVDGVISKFVDAFMFIYEDLGGHTPDDFVWDSWSAMDTLPDQGIRESVWDDERLFLIQNPYSGAIDALELLNSNYDVRIVTAVPHKHIYARDRWFKKHAPFIHRKNQMIFTSDKSIIDGDILIDDHLPHIKSWMEAGKPNGILIDRPWNQVDRWDEVGTRMAGLWEFCERIGLRKEEEE